MVMQEIFLLTKHGKFNAEYIEDAPVSKRRYYLHLLEKEAEEVKKQQDKIESQTKYIPKSGRGRR